MGLFGDIFGTMVNYNTAQQNMASQAAWNRRNLEFQKEGLAWQKSEANLTREREDTAIQRRIADLQAAGLNPLLAAGSPAAASTPVSTPIVPRGEAPQSNFKVDRNFSVLDSVQTAQALRLGAANVSRTETENLLLKERAREQAAVADLAELDRDIARSDFDSDDYRKTVRGRRAYYETEKIDEEAANIFARTTESYAATRKLNVDSARSQLEMAIRGRDFELLKEFGVMDSHGKLAQDWLDMATLVNPTIANLNLGVDEGLDALEKIMSSVTFTKGWYRNLFKKK